MKWFEAVMAWLGLGLLAYAAWRLNHIAGFAVAGLFLLWLSIQDRNEK